VRLLWKYPKRTDPFTSQVLPMTIWPHEEVLHFIENNRLMGKGLGYVDMHLCASARLTGVPLWTLDKTLNKINRELNIAY
jgi:predicted nucleic acid-binding protein